MFLQGQISLPLLIYNIFTRSNRYPSLRFTRFLQSQTSFLSSFCKVFTGSKQSPFIDLQEFYRFKPVSLFWFTMFLRVKSVSLFRFPRFLQGPINVLIYMMFTRYLHVLNKNIYGLFTKKILQICVKHFTRFYVVSYPLLPKDAGCKCFFYGKFTWWGKTGNWREFYFTNPIM